MYKAILYYIEGPRSYKDAIEKFNKIDHSNKIFGTTNGIGSYIKSVIGYDFSFRSMTSRFGYKSSEQIVEKTDYMLKIHIEANKNAIGRPINAVLIINKDTDTKLMTPIYFIALEEELSPNKPTWVNITVSNTKLRG